MNYLDLQDQNEYILVCSYFQLNQLIDVKPTPGSKYLRSITEPFSDEMKLDAERVRNWLDLLKLELHGMDSMDKLHASGHASGKEVRETLESISPKLIIPVHTEKPDHLKQFFGNVKKPIIGETIEL